MSGWDKKRDVMRRYDTTAQIYDRRYAQEQTAKYEAALESMKMTRFGLVLDAGCGTGLLFSHIAERANAVVGLDISMKSLVLARERAKNFPNVHLVHADVDRLPLKQGSVDRVFAITLIQNTPDNDRTLREIEKVSKDDAVIVVTGLKRIFSREDFEKLLRKVGLDISALKHEGNLRCYVATCAKHIIGKA